MISKSLRQSLRMMLLVGFVISAVTASGTMIAQGSTVTLHHQPVPCDPDC